MWIIVTLKANMFIIVKQTNNFRRYKSTGLTVWSNICIKFEAEQGILLNIFCQFEKGFLTSPSTQSLKLWFSIKAQD
jgi:hypothetical protein